LGTPMEAMDEREESMATGVGCSDQI
jgi:hypothetical protein